MIIRSDRRLLPPGWLLSQPGGLLVEGTGSLLAPQRLGHFR